MFTLRIAIVSWKFSKQMVIAKFTVEFEFMTLESSLKGIGLKPTKEKVDIVNT